jgi:hypothetical protein
VHIFRSAKIFLLTLVAISLSAAAWWSQLGLPPAGNTPATTHVTASLSVEDLTWGS